jgi:hypothetical protein
MSIIICRTPYSLYSHDASKKILSIIVYFSTSNTTKKLSCVTPLVDAGMFDSDNVIDLLTSRSDAS